MARHRFDVRQSPVDGKFRRWELVAASSCRDLLTGEADHLMWVVTGVYDTRKQAIRTAFANARAA